MNSTEAEMAWPMRLTSQPAPVVRCRKWRNSDSLPSGAIAYGADVTQIGAHNGHAIPNTGAGIVMAGPTYAPVNPGECRSAIIRSIE